MGGEIKISEEFLAILEEQYRKMIYNAYEWADNQRRESGIKVQPIKIKFPNGDRLEEYSDDFTVSMFYNEKTGECLLRRDWENKMAIQYNIVTNFGEIAKNYPNSVNAMLQNGVSLKRKWETF